MSRPADPLPPEKLRLLDTHSKQENTKANPIFQIHSIIGIYI